MDSAKAQFKSDLNAPTSQKKMKNKQIKCQIYQVKNTQQLLCHLRKIAKNLESIELIIPEVRGCSYTNHKARSKQIDNKICKK